MSWETFKAPLIFFEGEDEAAMITEFVSWRAKYPDYTIFQICDHIFRDLKDSGFRADQAAKDWHGNLLISKRIEEARNNGGNEPVKLTKDQLQAKILATVESNILTPQEKTARIKGLEAYASNEGWLVKAVEKKSLDLTPRFPTWVYEVPADAIG